MKNKKGFTLIIVIAILAIIMLIGTVACSSIQERKVRADKATAAQIEKAIKVRETDVGEENGIGLYPEVIEYDSINGIENYIAKEIKPQSMEDGNFVATAFQTQTGKKIVVGIGKKEEGSESYSIGDKVYNGKDESGWAWSEDIKIEEFQKDESVSGSISSGGTADVFPGVAIKANTEVEVGDYIYYTPRGGTAEIKGDESGTGEAQTFTVNATESKWRVIANNGGQLDIVPAEGSIEDDLALYGKVGYANAIGILNRICENYADGDKYAAGTRSLGYVRGASSLTKSEIDGMTHSNISSKCEEYTNSGDTSGQNYVNKLKPYVDLNLWKLPAGDDYTEEIEGAQSLGLRSVWLASRDVYVFGSYALFDVDYLGSDGSEFIIGLYNAGSDGSAGSYGDTFGVCPVVSLKPEIKILGGDGTLSKPYSMTEQDFPA